MKSLLNRPGRPPKAKENILEIKEIIALKRSDSGLLVKCIERKGSENLVVRITNNGNYSDWVVLNYEDNRPATLVMESTIRPATALPTKRRKLNVEVAVGNLNRRELNGKLDYDTLVIRVDGGKWFSPVEANKIIKNDNKYL